MMKLWRVWSLERGKIDPPELVSEADEERFRECRNSARIEDLAWFRLRRTNGEAQ